LTDEEWPQPLASHGTIAVAIITNTNRPSRMNQASQETIASAKAAPRHRLDTQAQTRASSPAPSAAIVSA
jgi:hypothetical protein